MAINNTKTRIIITIPKSQAEWIDKMAKKAQVSRSKYISWFMARKADELYTFMSFDEAKPSQEDLDEIIKIIKTPWLKQ